MNTLISKCKLSLAVPSQKPENVLVSGGGGIRELKIMDNVLEITTHTGPKVYVPIQHVEWFQID